MHWTKFEINNSYIYITTKWIRTSKIKWMKIFTKPLVRRSNLQRIQNYILIEVEHTGHVTWFFLNLLEFCFPCMHKKKKKLIFCSTPLLRFFQIGVWYTKSNVIIPHLLKICNFVHFRVTSCFPQKTVNIIKRHF